MRFREHSFTLFFYPLDWEFSPLNWEKHTFGHWEHDPISVAETGGKNSGTKEAFRMNHIRKCAIVLVHTGLSSFSKTTVLMKFNPRLRGPPSSSIEIIESNSKLILWFKLYT